MLMLTGNKYIDLALISIHGIAIIAAIICGVVAHRKERGLM